MERESFVFYDSFYEAIEELPPATGANLLYAICAYALRGKELELNGVEKACFKLIKPQIDANNKKYLDGIKGTEYGKLGGRPKKENPLGVFDENPKETPNVNVNVNDNVNENVNDNDSSAAEAPEPENKPTKKPPLRQRDPENNYERVEKAYLTNWDSLYRQGMVTTPDPVVAWTQTRALLKRHFQRLEPERIIAALKNGLDDEFVMQGGYSLAVMLSATVLNRLMNSCGPEAQEDVKREKQEKLALARTEAIAAEMRQTERYDPGGGTLTDALNAKVGGANHDEERR